MPRKGTKKTEKKEEPEEDIYVEEMIIDSKELISKTKEIIRAGNVRRIIIRKQSDEVLLELPLTSSVVVGGVMTLLAPQLAALGALAALLAKVKVQIVKVK